MPNRFFTTLKFVGTYSETAADGKIEIILRGNAPWDPYVAAGGEEVAGWDELAAIYSKYKCLSSGIRFTVCNLDSDDPVFVSVYPSGTAAENDLCRSEAQRDVRTGTATLDGGTAVVSNWASAKKMLYPINDATTCALTSASPTTEWYWHCHMHNVSGNALNLVYKLEMSYHVEMFDLKEQSQS